MAANNYIFEEEAEAADAALKLTASAIRIPGSSTLRFGDETTNSYTKKIPGRII